MIFPLAVLVAKRLLEIQSRHGLNVQFQHHFGLKPLVNTFVGIELSIGHHVVVEGFVLPDVVTRLRVLVVES